MGANHDTIKEEPKKPFKLKNKVAGSSRCLHNSSMINKLLNNYWFNCAFAVYQAFCTGLMTVIICLKFVDVLFGKF